MNAGNHIRLRLAAPIASGLLLLACALSVHADETSVQVRVDVNKAGPRAVEPLTERGIVRDYRFAWSSLAQALAFNTLDPLQGPFSGQAMQWLRQTVAAQQQSGLRLRYVGQSHHLEAVFYAPEGDVIELHDTAQYRLQVLDGDKAIHDENVVVHYVVLMSPGADRWTIRQLQAVPQF